MRGHQTNAFIVNSVDVGEIKKIKIGYNTDTKPDWHLDVIITVYTVLIIINKTVTITYKGKSWWFYCNKWLYSHTTDKNVEHEFFVATGIEISIV